MDRQAWLEARRRGMGGSDVPPILGAPGAYRTAFEVWLDKTGQGGPDEDTPVKRRGRAMEDAVARMYAEETGHVVGCPAEVLSIGPEPWMLGSFDRLVRTADEQEWGLECKTARGEGSTPGMCWHDTIREAAGAAAADIVPAAYALQCLWYLAVAEIYDRFDISVYFTIPDEFRIYSIYRDQEYEERLVETVRGWWVRHVINGEVPEMDGSTGARGWVSRTLSPSETYRDATPEEAAMWARRETLKATIKEAEGECATIDNRILAALKDHKGLAGMCRRQPTGGGDRIDVKRLRAELPAIAAAYTTESKSGWALYPAKRR